MSAISTAISELKRVSTATFDEEKVNSIIIKHSVTAAAAGLASGVIPGVGGIIATLTGIGAIWSMYYRICKELEINVSQNFLKGVASGLLSNIVANLGAALIAELAASFIPVVSIVVNGAACYALTYLSGLIFIKLLTKMYLKGKNPAAMSESDFSEFGKAAASETDCRTVFKEAMANAKKQIRDGQITKDSAS